MVTGVFHTQVLDLLEKDNEYAVHAMEISNSRYL